MQISKNKYVLYLFLGVVVECHVHSFQFWFVHFTLIRFLACCNSQKSVSECYYIFVLDFSDRSLRGIRLQFLRVKKKVTDWPPVYTRQETSVGKRSHLGSWPSSSFLHRKIGHVEGPGNQCCGPGMFIPDPGSDFFSIPDHGSEVFPSRIPDPHQSILTQKNGSKL